MPPATDAPVTTAEEVPEPARREPRRAAGWRVVAAKELADHVTSVRFTILLILMGLAAAGTVVAASGVIRGVASQANEVPSLFLRLFTVASEDVPSFFTTVGIIGFLAPLLGIAFGFDAVNGERSQGTLPRLVSQPIHRDDVINGKFAAGLGVIALMLTTLVVIVAGIGLVRLGIVPDAGDVGRLLVWLAVTLLYVAFWLGFSTMCSVVFPRAATSALVAISAWLVVTIFWSLLVPLAANLLAPVPDQASAEEVIRNARVELQIGRISPTILYDETTLALLNPEVRTVGFFLPEQLDRAVASILPLDQSLLIVWGQIVGLVALTVICFAVAYVQFMQQEIRA